MKNLIFYLLPLLFSNTLLSQQNYNFTQLTQNYTELSGLTLFQNGYVWNNQGLNWNFQLPFSFNIAGTNYSVFSYDGSVIELFATNGTSAQLYAHGIYINDKSTTNSGTSISPVGYKTEGTSGNRIVKIQFKNVGSATEYAFLNTRTITMNFQIWLYEGTNVIEYHIGSNNVNTYLADVNELIMFGLSREQGNSFISVLYSSHSNPLYGEYINPDEIDLDNYGMKSYPVANTVYRFTPSTSASNTKFIQQGFTIYPNPVTDELLIGANELAIHQIESIEIFDLTGKRLSMVENNFSQINVGHLVKGSYILKIKSIEGTQVSKFIKK